MYFWKINDLKRDIAHGELKEKDIFVYFFIYVVLETAAIELFSLIPRADYNVWDIVNSISMSLVTIIGVCFLFRANGGSKGKNFLGKYFSIGFVLFIKFMAAMIPFLVIMIFYYTSLSLEGENITSTAFETILFLLWYVAYFWRLYKHIGDVKDF